MELDWRGYEKGIWDRDQMKGKGEKRVLGIRTDINGGYLSYYLEIWDGEAPASLWGDPS